MTFYLYLKFIMMNLIINYVNLKDFIVDIYFNAFCVSLIVCQNHKKFEVFFRKSFKK